MLLRLTLLVNCLIFTLACTAYDPDDEALCKEWAIQDGVTEEDMASYIKACLQSIDYQEPIYEESATDEEQEADSNVYGPN